MWSKSRLRAATFAALALALVMSACAAEEEAAPEEPEEAAVTTAAPEAAPAADADACDEIINASDAPMAGRYA